MFRPRFALALAVLSALVLAFGQAEARPGFGGSFGSRGMRTTTPPPITRTAPTPASPLERTMTQPARPTVGMAPPAAANRSWFNRPGFFGGILTGLLGAGLLGLLFGNGLFGGLGGLASILGLMLQVALVVVVARLLWAWWQRRNTFAVAGGPPVSNLFARDEAAGSGAASYGANGYSAGRASGVGSAIEISKADFDTFEHRLSDVTLAYGTADLGRLRGLVTPEMLSYFADDLGGLCQSRRGERKQRCQTPAGRPRRGVARR